MTQDEMWEIVIGNDNCYDGIFYYAVKTTGIYCNPSCKSKTPLRKNVEFFDNIAGAEKAGYRACKRCQSNLTKIDVATQVQHLIETYFHDKTELDNQINFIPLSQHRVIELFKQEYDMTPKQSLNNVRINKAKELLENTNIPIIDIAYDVGYNSLSAFNRQFQTFVGTSPNDYRRKKNI